jgi:hypothetical protein
MTDTNAATDKNAIAAWYKSQLDTVGYAGRPKTNIEEKTRRLNLT